MSVIPFGICREILLWLPAESLLRFRTVCKRWRAVIDDPRFVKSHTDNQLSSTTIIIRNSNGPPLYPLYYFRLEDLNFTNAQQTIPVTPLILSRTGLSRLNSLPLSACNGLMLFAPEYREVNRDGQIHWESMGTWEIWNPLTGERLKLPDPNIILCVVCAGIGYDCVADDYRVVVVDYDGESTRRTHVYSLKSDSWRKIGDCPFGILSPDIQHGVFLNGSLHLVSSDDGIIIAFEFAAENYRHMALPDLGARPAASLQLEALGGCLFLSYHDKWDSNNWDCQHFHVWVMNNYGAEDSWIKLFSLKNDYSGRGNNIRDSQISARVCLRNLLRLHNSCGRVASKIRTRKRGAIKKADTKLTFCVRDHKISDPGEAYASHEDCYKIDSNWHASSCQGENIHTSSSNPDSDSLVPLDICREIFLHLPAKSLIRFRAVSKAYWAIIEEPCFVRAHTNKQPLVNTILLENSSGPPFYPLYSFDLDAVNCTYDLRLQRIPTITLGVTHRGLSYLSASVCNGLILIPNKKWEMWNPLTNECLQLPTGEFNSDIMTTGIGYDNTNDDYKVVVIDCYGRQLKDHVKRTHVYSLRSDSWRIIGNFPIEDYWLSSIWPGVSLCGALHWLSSQIYKIIALDLRTEKYSQLQWPPLRRRSSITWEERCLEVLGGCLVMIDYVIAFDGDDDYLDVWVMKEYGAEDSWINVFSINDISHSFSKDIRPVAFLKDESQILLQDDKGFILFDSENDHMQKLKIHGLSRSSYAHAFSGSIFRLHGNCGVGGSESFRTKRIRITNRQTEISDTELYLCVSDGGSRVTRRLHEDCHRLDSNWC